MKRIFLTGAAGFIGYHTAVALLAEGYEVMGFDNLNDYYDPQLKKDRLSELGIICDNLIEGKVLQSTRFTSFQFIKGNLTDLSLLSGSIKGFGPNIVLHLAAQAGVRYSIQNPSAYIDSNIIGFFNVLEACRHQEIKQLIYASSSSVYGNSSNVPFHEDANVDQPVSLYAATKRTNELLAHTYSHLYGISTTGLRFFTVYGPWGRPDMAPFLFTDAVLNERPIKVFNNGALSRDFTYVSDIVDGIIALLIQPITAGQHLLFNIGNSQPEELGTFISLIEKHTGKQAIKENHKMQPGDVYRTFADVKALNQYCGYNPKVSLDEGLKKFVDWYMSYHNSEK